MVKRGITGMRAWDLGIIFLCVPNLWFGGLKRFFYENFSLQGVMEKCVSCFLVYSFYGSLFYFLKKKDDEGFKICMKPCTRRIQYTLLKRMEGYKMCQLIWFSRLLFRLKLYWDIFTTW